MTAPPRPDLHRQYPGTSPKLLDELAHLTDEYGPAGVAVTLDALHPGIFPLARRLDRRRSTVHDRPSDDRSAYSLGRVIGYAVVALSGIASVLALVALIRISYRWALG